MRDEAQMRIREPAVNLVREEGTSAEATVPQEGEILLVRRALLVAKTNQVGKQPKEVSNWAKLGSKQSRETGKRPMAINK